MRYLLHLLQVINTLSLLPYLGATGDYEILTASSTLFNLENMLLPFLVIDPAQMHIYGSDSCFIYGSTHTFGLQHINPTSGQLLTSNLEFIDLTTLFDLLT
jgi:hypothetical protein